MITSLGLPGKEQQLRKLRDSGEGRHHDYNFLGAPRREHKRLFFLVCKWQSLSTAILD